MFVTLGLVLFGIACDYAGDSAFDPQTPTEWCGEESGESIVGTVTDPVAVPGHLAHPAAEQLVGLERIAYRDTVNARDYGMRGDGVTDNTAALQAAINAVSPGTAIFIPKSDRPYVLRGQVRLRSNVGLVSDGATLDTRDFTGSSLLLRDVRGVEIAGLRFIGTTKPATYSRAVDITGSSSGNLVRDNYFRFYYGGAVVVQSNENTVRDNIFEEVNNSPAEAGAHYGSIHLLTADRNVIVGNEIRDFDYSGISLYASSDNRIAENVVRTREGFPRDAMGIYILAGSSGNLIERNDVSLATNECIVLISNNEGGHVEGNVVRDNRNADCPYAGISLQKNGKYEVRGNLVERNRIEAFGLGDRDIDHAILLVGARDNIIRQNEVESDGRQIETGIRTMSAPAGNVVEANVIEGVSGDGIIAMGAGSRYVGNTVRRARTGIFVSEAPDAVITGNAVTATSSNSIRIKSKSPGAQIYDNRVDRPVRADSGTGASIWGNEVLDCR